MKYWIGTRGVGLVTTSSVCKGKINFALERAMKVQRERVEVLLYSFLNLGARWGWVVSATPWPLYLWERDPVPIA
jgi:hypothetical protein